MIIVIYHYICVLALRFSRRSRRNGPLSFMLPVLHFRPLRMLLIVLIVRTNR